MVLHDLYDEDLPGATLAVLKTWETTFLPPPALIRKECQKMCHRRMKQNEEHARLLERPAMTAAEDMARLTRLKEIVKKGHL